MKKILFIKGFHYFDQLLDATPNWDFYGVVSLGITILKTIWDKRYTSEKNKNTGSGP